ncbi:hypothetical protein HHK36_022015 [Tetracentron sinense]|uniref:Cytochrome P450 n=1 Tax=Tetracentron sinense TaxID=13715 RepID=A0A834YRD3_TETSI|nr:hypothetical protein HHK36_022015 [Tetracentron sinense]
MLNHIFSPSSFLTKREGVMHSLFYLVSNSQRLGESSLFKIVLLISCSLLGLLTLACLAGFTAFRSKFRPKCYILPPGSFGWPLVGETLIRQRLGQLGKPEEYIKRRRLLYGKDVFKTSLLLQPVAVVCGPAANKFLFSNENKLVVTWWTKSIQNVFPSSVLTSRGLHARPIKKLLTAFLKPEALQSYVGTMDSITQSFMETEWGGKEEIMVFPLLKLHSFVMASRIFTTIQDPNIVQNLTQQFHVLMDGIIEIPLNIPGTRYYRAMRARDVICRDLLSVIKQRRVALSAGTVSPTHDLLTSLLSTADENGRFLTEKEITDNILLLLFSAHGTTSSTIAMLMRYLAEMPHIYEEILREQIGIAASKAPGELLDWKDIRQMKYSWNTTCEVLRLSPPIEGTFREAITDLTYGGFDIPKGWKLFWSVHSSHKNPEYFPEPEKFDPSRFDGDGPAPYTYVPFGGAPRRCPGYEYARLEIWCFSIIWSSGSDGSLCFLMKR